MQVDYYKILGISYNASVEEIRQAYRNRAKQYHPDINKSPNANVLFQLLNEAYQVLINPEKKRWYDFKLKYPSTTGFKQQQGKQRTATYESYYRAYTRQQQEKNAEKEFKKYTRSLIDNVLFYSLIFSGALAIFFSIREIIFDTWSLKSISGIAFGAWFLIVMFWGWITMRRK